MTPEEKSKIQKVFSVAHQSEKDLEASGQFTQNVMRRVRNLGKEESEIRWDFLQPVIWRFVSSAAFLAIVLSAYVMQTGFLPKYEVAELFLDNAVAVFQFPSIM